MSSPAPSDDQPPYGSHGTTATPTGDRTLAAVAHLSALVAFVGVPSVIGPLIMLLVVRNDPYVAEHTKEALNFNLSILLYSLGAVLLAIATLGLALVVIVPTAIAGAIAWFILVIVAAVRAGESSDYRYPLTIRLVR